MPFTHHATYMVLNRWRVAHLAGSLIGLCLIARYLLVPNVSPLRHVCGLLLLVAITAWGHGSPFRALRLHLQSASDEPDALTPEQWSTVVQSIQTRTSAVMRALPLWVPYTQSTVDLTLRATDVRQILTPTASTLLQIPMHMGMREDAELDDARVS